MLLLYIQEFSNNYVSGKKIEIYYLRPKLETTNDSLIPFVTF